MACGLEVGVALAIALECVLVVVCPAVELDDQALAPPQHVHLVAGHPLVDLGERQALAANEAEELVLED